MVKVGKLYDVGLQTRHALVVCYDRYEVGRLRTAHSIKSPKFEPLLTDKFHKLRYF